MMGQNFARSVSLLFSWDRNLMTCCGQKGWSCALSCANVQKVVTFFSLVNYQQVWWAGLAQWRITRDIGVCSWEKGMERLPPYWHQCLELAISCLGTFIFWEPFSPNNTASQLFFTLVATNVSSCPCKTRTKKKPPQKPEKKPLSPKRGSYLLLSVSQKSWGLKRKGSVF